MTPIEFILDLVTSLIAIVIGAGIFVLIMRFIVRFQNNRREKEVERKRKAGR